MGGVAEFVGDVVGGAIDFFDDLFGGGGGCSYHPEASKTEAHAKKIADELAEMKENIRTVTEDRERKIINHINQYMDSLIQCLEEENKKNYGGKTLNINVGGIRERYESLKKDVVGYIGNIMDQRLVLTDTELSVILEELDDKKRARNFDKFVAKIQEQSLNGLKGQIEKTVREQEQMIEREIKIRLSEVNKNMKDIQKAYFQILQAKENQDETMADMRIGYMYKYEIAGILLRELETAE